MYLIPIIFSSELMFLETSALTGENVEEAFLKCSRTILSKIESGKEIHFMYLSALGFPHWSALWDPKSQTLRQCCIFVLPDTDFLVVSFSGMARSCRSSIKLSDDRWAHFFKVYGHFCSTMMMMMMVIMIIIINPVTGVRVAAAYCTLFVLLVCG